LLRDKLRLNTEAREDLLERFPIVAAVGIIRIDTGDPFELALEVLDRQQ
jgi:nicotinic acid phosphoribosyltransferase